MEEQKQVVDGEEKPVLNEEELWADAENPWEEAEGPEPPEDEETPEEPKKVEELVREHILRGKEFVLNEIKKGNLGVDQ